MLKNVSVSSYVLLSIDNNMDLPRISHKLTDQLSKIFDRYKLKYPQDKDRLDYAFDDVGLIYYFWPRGFEARTNECDVYLHLLNEKLDVMVDRGKMQRARRVLTELENTLIQYKKRPHPCPDIHF